MPETPKTNIIEGSHLPEYLRKKIRQAAVVYDLQLTEIAEFYLVNMLINFGKTEHLFKPQENHLEEEPLALMLEHAINGDTATQIRELKRLGDTALYIAGLFKEHIRRSLVDVGYYIDMGSFAYSALSRRFSTEDTFEKLYTELSEKFPNVVIVLGEISLADHIKTNLALVKLYEQWLKTKDEHIQKILIKEGLKF